MTDNTECTPSFFHMSAGQPLDFSPVREGKRTNLKEIVRGRTHGLGVSGVKRLGRVLLTLAGKEQHLR